MAQLVASFEIMLGFMDGEILVPGVNEVPENVSGLALRS